VLVTDYHGSLRSEVGFGSGGGTDLIEYYPYGELYMQSGSSKSRFEFIGKERDDVRDPDFGPRYYNSTVGHFLSPDPILSAPSAYAYTDGNPVMQYDPSGMHSEEIYGAHVHLGGPSGGPSDDGSDPDPFDIDPYARLDDYEVTQGNFKFSDVTLPINYTGGGDPSITTVPGVRVSDLDRCNDNGMVRAFYQSGNVSYGGGTGGRGGGGGGVVGGGFNILGFVGTSCTVGSKAIKYEQRNLAIALGRGSSTRAPWFVRLGRLAKGLGTIGKRVGELGVGVSTISFALRPNWNDFTDAAVGGIAIATGSWILAVSYFAIDAGVYWVTDEHVGYYVGRFVKGILDIPGRRTIPGGFWGARGL